MEGYGSYKRPQRARESASLSNLNHPSSTRSSYPSSNYSNPTSSSRDPYNSFSNTTPRDSSYSIYNFPSSNNNNRYSKSSSHSGYSTPVKTTPPDLTGGHSNGVSRDGTPSTIYQPTTFTTIPIHSNGTNGLHNSR